MLPRRALVWLLAAAGGVGLAAMVAGLAISAWSVAAASILLAALVDALRVLREPLPSLHRVHPEGWTQGRAGTCTLVVGPAEREVLVHDHHPRGWQANGLPARLEPGTGHSVPVRLVPDRRGPARFEPADVRVSSPWRLWWRSGRAGIAESVVVFPDFSWERPGEAPGEAREVPSRGMRILRRRGEGTEFHQLREYRRGDPLRAVDWKATARQGRLVSREYQEERDQSVVVVLDSGHRMTRLDGGKTHLDRCLESALRLFRVAARQGDSFGLLGISDRVVCWVPPAKGRFAFERIARSSHDLQPEEAPADWILAAELLREKVRRRSLVVFLSVLEEEDAPSLARAVSLLDTRHLPLCVSVREPVLDRIVRDRADSLETAQTQAAVFDLLQSRRKAIGRMGLPRLLHLETTPTSLREDLTERYLNIKRSGRL